MGSPPLRTIKGRILTADSWVSDFIIYLNGNYFGIYQHNFVILQIDHFHSISNGKLIQNRLLLIKQTLSHLCLSIWLFFNTQVKLLGHQDF